MIRPIEKLRIGGTWNVSHEDGAISAPVPVPGSVYEALIDAGTIDDPFHGENEHQMEWVYESSWHFETAVDITASILEHDHVLLRCHGIDTFSEVRVNGNLVGITANMHEIHEFEVRSHLKTGTNGIKITITSPTKAARAEKRKLGLNLRTSCALPGVPFLRKAQYSFGWDWGPKLPDIAIWQPVELVAHDGMYIDSAFPIQVFTYTKDPLTITDPNEISLISVEHVAIKLQVELATTGAAKVGNGLSIKATLVAPDGRSFETSAPVDGTRVTLDFQVPKPVLWWTHDLGTPALHELAVMLVHGSTIIDTLSQKIGLRDVKLVRRPDKWGESFFFMLNGVPLFAKGANWVPVDSFIPRGKRLGLYEMLLNDAKEANMNFLRVWGGGIYEDDVFYDTCDELGILTWQDFPFACAVYPPTREFVDAVRREAAMNVKRLRHHASLAAWIGNNEIEQLFLGVLLLVITWRVWLKGRFTRAYLELFEQVLPAIVAELDPTRSYWPSSPSNGGGDRARGPLASNDPNVGDSHFWKVWHLNAPFSEYRKFDSRFMSEFGFESFPHMRTIVTFCPPEQYAFDSPVMANHQKNRAGNGKIMSYMKRRFDIPTDFRRQVILSQIVQAEAMEYGVEHWRRNRNEQHCMGALYWQLNDCWPVASWSSIDYFGRWKALHYLAKRFYAPFFASVKEDRDSTEIWVTNDRREARTGKLSWKIVDPSGLSLLSGSKDVVVAPCSSLLAETIDTAAINADDAAMNTHAVLLTLEPAAGSGDPVARGFRFFGEPRNFPLRDPQLAWHVEKTVKGTNDVNTYDIVIEARQLAMYVYIEPVDADFIAADNFFAMEPGETRRVPIRVVRLPASAEEEEARPATPDAVKAAIKVGSLFDLLELR
ncbi:MAG: glycoside hydrolase family 2 protein [Candidatus Lokiarchaeota archaeon]|nr:glycoside hydrolase family 2 protein [Candidatus Lokiarchaeota archaeon]